MPGSVMCRAPMRRWGNEDRGSRDDLRSAFVTSRRQADWPAPVRLYLPTALRHCAVLRTARPAAQGSAGVTGEPDGPQVHGQAFGGKNTRVRTSMLSLGGASAGRPIEVSGTPIQVGYQSVSPSRVMR